LEIVFYGMGACEPMTTKPVSQRELLRQLHAWGLPTVENPRPARGPDEVWKAVQAVGRERAKLGFPIDGAVIKLDNVSLQDQLGVTAQAPLWAIAYKFVPDRVETRIRAITLQIGRTGVLTPVAELAPVKIGGSNVARVSLFNRDEIARRDIRVGDFVYVEKAGDIIPAIASVDRARRTPEVKPFAFPERCPSCNGALIQSAGEAATRCPNRNCPVQIEKRVEYFASKSCVGISGLGPATIGKMVETGAVKNVADLYSLRREDLIPSGGNGAKSADRILSAIENSKHGELWRFINGLGIPQVGEAAARSLARHFGDLATLAHAQPKEFLQDGRPVIPGVKEGASRAVIAHFLLTENVTIVDRLVAAGVGPHH